LTRLLVKIVTKRTTIQLVT